MIEQILQYLELAGVAISLFAVAIILFSFVIPTWRYARPFQEADQEQNFSRFKKELGSGLMLGLEILVLADVIETMTVTPTFQSLSILASIVVIRTAVSWTLTLEIEGRWPWQSPDNGQKND
jgi:uncharacterized membrane protein